MSSIDHLVVVVDDLSSSASQWAACTGIAFQLAGRHPGGTENALAVLQGQDLYLELISVYDPSAPSAWTRRAAAARGPLAWALSVDDVDAAVAAVRACGVEVRDPEDGSRICPDGRVVRWRSAYLGEVPGADGWPFLIEWPRTGPERLGVPVTSRRVVTGIEVAVPDTELSARVLCEALGLQRVSGHPSRLTDGEVDLDLVAGREAHRPLSVSVADLPAQVAIDGCCVRPGAAAVLTSERGAG